MKSKKILLALDYHSASVNAYNYALKIAEIEKCELHLLHAFHVPVPALDTAVPILSMKEVQTFENKRIDRFVHEHHLKGKLKINAKAIEGLAGDVLEQWVIKNKPDLVVMGIHETGALDEFLMGSTCERVIKQDLVPILIVPSKARFKKIHLMTLATDLKEIKIPHISDKLKHFCKRFQSRLMILHITEENEIKFSEEKENLEKLEEELHEIKHQFKETESNKKPEAILHEILKNRSQWLVLIHKNYSFIREIFHKSLIKKMIFNSEIPILILNSGYKK